jgi:hypothetical protein
MDLLRPSGATGMPVPHAGTTGESKGKFVDEQCP